MALALDRARVRTFVLCHKTLDTVAVIHFCMVIVTHLLVGAPGDICLQIFYFGCFIGRIIIHWCIFRPFFIATAEEYVAADWIKGMNISISNLFCLHFLFPRKQLILRGHKQYKSKWKEVDLNVTHRADGCAAAVCRRLTVEALPPPSPFLQFHLLRWRWAGGWRLVPMSAGAECCWICRTSHNPTPHSNWQANSCLV